MKKSGKLATAFIETTIFVPKTLVDAVSNYVTDNIASGVELKENGPDSPVGVTFYVPESSKSDYLPAFREYLSQIINAEMPAVPEIHESKIISRDWEESYRKSIEPVIIDEVICIRPPWAKPPIEVQYDIIIEPKMAFGTGHHETTRTCLALVRKHFRGGGRFLDFGCGSGVLAILAAQMGAAFVKAVDFDIIAVENTRENFEINGVTLENAIQHGSFEQVQADETYDMVCANLTAPVLVENFDKLLQLTDNAGNLILSGILDIEKVEIDAVIKNAELRSAECVQVNEWLTYFLNK